MSRARVWAKRILPVAVSFAFLAFLASRVDLASVAAALTGRGLVELAAALVVYAAATLALEAASLARLVPDRALAVGTAARIKAASYLLAVVHYTIGMGALTVLIRRRSGLEIGKAAGMVLLLAALDLGVLIAFCGVGASLDAGSAPALRASVVGATAAAMIGGFVVVRTPVSLGPLDRIRSLGVLQALATTPLPRLVELVGWRVLFVSSFLAIVAAALAAFDLHVPLPTLFVGVTVCALVSVLPIAFSGLGTGQAAFVYVFRDFGDEGTLLACSLALSLGMIAVRAAVGAIFAREYAREALALVEVEEAA